MEELVERLPYCGMTPAQASHEAERLIEQASRSGDWLSVIDDLIALRRIAQPRERETITDVARQFMTMMNFGISYRDVIAMDRELREDMVRIISEGR